MAKYSSDTLALRCFNNGLSFRISVRAVTQCFVLSLSLLGLVVLSVFFGSYSISAEQIWHIVLDPVATDPMSKVIWEFRIPRVIGAVLVGAMLALSGSALQTVTRNGLADPSLVGISQGAALAVVLFSIVWPESASLFRPWVAFIGAMLVAFIVLALSWSQRSSSSIRFILIGIGLSAFVGSITAALLTYGDPDQAMSALAWLSGSVNAVGWPEVKLLSLCFLLFFPVLLSQSRSITAYRVGRTVAVGLGLSDQRVYLTLVAVAVALAAIATAIVGPLSFVGLIAPHLARYLCHSGEAMHQLVCALVGAIVVVLADLLGRSVFPDVQIPVGVVTAIIGVPAFILLLQRARGSA